MEKKFYLEISKRGIPCLWESGGGATNTGDAQIIAHGDGLRITPIYINRRGHLSCGDHALIPVGQCDVVIVADHHRGDFNIQCFDLDGRVQEEIIPGQPERSAGGFGTNPAIPEKRLPFMEGRLVSEFSNGEWDSLEGAGELQLAVDAAKEKALCYHCREPHYILATE